LTLFLCDSKKSREKLMKHTIFLLTISMSALSFASSTSTDIPLDEDLTAAGVVTQTKKIKGKDITKTVGVFNLAAAQSGHLGCQQTMGQVRVEGFDFEDGGSRTIASFYGHYNGSRFNFPTNFTVLNKFDRESASQFIKAGKKYFVRFQMCGSGGFVDLIDIFDSEYVVESKL
jgi:hypothetical protein